ncbi:MAG: hypothetical protein EOM26_03165 [Alphaproteobacteria bacterium]|nr:hypothetical protein [Alphaproteobacteria bacterium]
MKRLFALCCSLMLGSCASVMEGQTQSITVETPGAENALCYIQSDEWRYTVRPPESVQISKAGDTLELFCKAPGNREKSVMIEPVSAETLLLNIGTALLPGLAYDRASGAMWVYPELVTVDFRDVPAQPMPMPARYADDLLPPLGSGLEEFRSGHPALSEDADRQTVPIRRRDEGTSDDSSGALPGESTDFGRDVPPVDDSGLAESGDFVPSAPPTPRSSLPGMPGAGAASAEDLTQMYNPGVFRPRKALSGVRPPPYAPETRQEFLEAPQADSTPLELFLEETQ